jgi:hypothetical protein
MKEKTDLFSSRYAFLFAAIGMAIGAGNIWRFPRLAGQYGGSFLILWWFFQSVNWYPETWWDPFGQFTIGTCIFQWIIVILIGVIFNEKLSRAKAL